MNKGLLMSWSRDVLRVNELANPQSSLSLSLTEAMLGHLGRGTICNRTANAIADTGCNSC